MLQQHIPPCAPTRPGIKSSSNTLSQKGQWQIRKWLGVWLLNQGHRSRMEKSHRVDSLPSHLPWMQLVCSHHPPLLTYHNLLLMEHFLQSGIWFGLNTLVLLCSNDMIARNKKRARDAINIHEGKLTKCRRPDTISFYHVLSGLLVAKTIYQVGSSIPFPDNSLFSSPDLLDYQ